MRNRISKDVAYLIGGSGVVVLALLGVMFFSPLASQFPEAGALRGSHFDMQIDVMLKDNQPEQALNFVDSLISTKRQGLSRFAYFDRFLPEEERQRASSARATIYDLQWRRIEILAIMDRTEALRSALSDYSKIIGHRQDTAKLLLKRLN